MLPTGLAGDRAWQTTATLWSPSFLVTMGILQKRKLRLSAADPKVALPLNEQVESQELRAAPALYESLVLRP